MIFSLLSLRTHPTIFFVNKKLQEELTDRDFDPLRTCILSVLRAVQVSCGEFQIAIELCDLERILRFGCC
jgi:hypothetical protein